MAKNDREHIRLQLDTRVFIELAAADPVAGTEAELLQCKVLDVSWGGLKVEIEEPLIDGSILSIGVFLPGVDEPFYLAGEVRWCIPVDLGNTDGNWTAGFKVLTSSGSDADSWREFLDHV